MTGELHQISLAIGEMRARVDTNCKKLDEVKNLLTDHIATEETRLRTIEDKITEAKGMARVGAWVMTIGSGMVGGGLVTLAKKIGIIS